LNIERVMIALLLSLLVWFGATIIRLENYHYAAALRMCDEHIDLAKRSQCLNAKETRTSSIYHLLYGLRVFRGVE